MKTAKFSEVVRKCGEPSIYLAWVDPTRDKTLKRALAEHRVMTLHQELHGGKKDFGSVGFLKDRHAQLLVFPKSLRKFSDRKVIAIDYSKIAKDSASPGTIPREAQAGRSTPAKHPVQILRKSEPKLPVRKGTVAMPLPKPRTVKNKSLAKAGPRELEEILTEVKRAVGELAAGKSVPAYDRLKRLIGQSST